MNTIRRDDFIVDNDLSAGSCVSAVTWSAIIAGAFTAAAISLILLVLGSAFGLSSVSPWSNSETLASFTVKTAIWLIVMQWVASGIGGYLTGRLRSKWVSVHTDEVFFRDTAHGFLAWAVATVLTASVLASATSSVISGGAHVAAAVTAGAAAGAGQAAAKRPDDFGDSTGYYIDSLFRSNGNAPATPNAVPSSTPAMPPATAQTSMPSNAPALNPPADVKEMRAETTRILMVDLKNGTVPDADKAYLAQLVSARTGLSNADASKRVEDVIAALNDAKEKAKEKAEEARETAMHVSIYLFLSFLVGAFIASSAAALGGQHRDKY